MKYAYFGSSQVSIYVLEELVNAGFTPALIVTTHPKPQGRGLVMTPNIVRTWAEEHDIPVIDPKRLDHAVFETLEDGHFDTFIVASYGKILPKDIVFMPTRGTLNMHPSLLPRYRGAAPIPTTMLDDTKETGITIMHMDEQMDHGPIVATKDVTVTEWPTYEAFEEQMAREGGRLLAQMLPDWVGGRITTKAQDHAAATFTKKIKKEDAEIRLSDDAYTNFRKIQAYHEWPKAYFFAKKGALPVRVKITSASWKDGTLIIEKVIPEGSREMAFSDFQKGYVL